MTGTPFLEKAELLIENSIGIEMPTDIFEKCNKFTRAKELMSAGLYPYFRTVESAQDPEVVLRGRRMIMIGSNNYLGLTNHPKVEEAAIQAIDKYGSGCAGSRFLNGIQVILCILSPFGVQFFHLISSATQYHWRNRFQKTPSLISLNIFHY